MRLNLKNIHMLDLAHQIIAVGHNHKILVYPYALQEYLYWLVKELLINHDVSVPAMQKVYNEPFLVWRYGPVVKNIYNVYSVFNANPIMSEYLCNPKLNRLNTLILKILNYNALKLCRLSRSEPFWQVNKKYIHGWKSNVSYSLKNIAYQGDNVFK